MYDYSRTRRVRTAATMDLHGEWRDIVSKHDHAERLEMETLLKKMVPYLGSVGFDLDLRKSYLAKRYSGSDGMRLDGALVVTEREENTTQSPDGQSVSKWLRSAIGIGGSARLVRSGPEKNRMGEKVNTWEVDISEW